MRILIVEDVPEMLELLHELISKIPGVTHTAKARNSSEARLEMRRHKPTAVILDEVLPGESSVDLAEELADERVPMIFVTGSLAAKSTLPKGVLSRLLKPEWDDLDRRRGEFAAVLSAIPIRID